jgi:hypothetical protein
MARIVPPNAKEPLHFSHFTGIMPLCNAVKSLDRVVKMCYILSTAKHQSF